MTYPTRLGLILAGGLSRRMGGGDKPLRPLAGRAILARVLARLGPQCSGVIINANGDSGRFAEFGLPVVPDGLPDHPGPLAGVLAGLDWAHAHRPDVTEVVSVAGDTPFLPRDLVARLNAARPDGGGLSFASSAGRTHPVDALWPVAIRDSIRQALATGERRMGRFMADHDAATADWPSDPVDPFFNVNAPDDLAAAERLIAQHGEP